MFSNFILSFINFFVVVLVIVLIIIIIIKYLYKLPMPTNLLKIQEWAEFFEKQISLVNKRLKEKNNKEVKPKTKFFSLKPINDTSKIKSYSEYKEILDYSIKENRDISDIGLIGGYGTGKTTLIKSYLNNEIKNKRKYDIVYISLLNLNNSIKGVDNIQILKHIIKQLVYIKKDNLQYNILNYRKFEPKSFFGIVIFLCLVYFNILFLDLLKLPLFKENNIDDVTYNLFIDVMLEKNILLWFIIILTISNLVYLYFILKYLIIKVNLKKVDISSSINSSGKVNIGMESKNKNINIEDLYYIEYFIYLITDTKKKNVVIVIEDIDRYGDLKIFEQLKEVSKIVNENYTNINFKFIFSVKPEIFSLSFDNKEDKVVFKESLTKFFDIVIQLKPVVDSNNIYAYLTEILTENKEHPNVKNKLLDCGSDTFFLCRFIKDVRVLNSIFNDYLRQNVEENDAVTMFYFSILKMEFSDIYNELYELLDMLKAKYESFIKSYSIEEYKKNNLNEIIVSYLSRGELSNSQFRGSYIAELDKFLKGKNYNQRIDIIINSKYINLLENFKSFVDNRYNAIINNLGKEYDTNKTEGIQKFINKELKMITGDIVEENDKKFKLYLDNEIIKVGFKKGFLNPYTYKSYLSRPYLSEEEEKYCNEFYIGENTEKSFAYQLKNMGAIIPHFREKDIVGNNGLNFDLFDFIVSKEFSTLQDNEKKILLNSIRSHSFVKNYIDSRNNIDKIISCNYLIDDTNVLKDLLKFIEQKDKKIYDDLLIKVDKKLVIDNISDEDGFTDKTIEYLLKYNLIKVNNNNCFYLLKKYDNYENEKHLYSFSRIVTYFEDSIIRKENDTVNFIDTYIKIIDKIFKDESTIDNFESFKTLLFNIMIEREEQVKDLRSIKSHKFFNFIYQIDDTKMGLYELNYENIKFLVDKSKENKDFDYQDFNNYIENNKDEYLNIIAEENKYGGEEDNEQGQDIFNKFIHNNIFAKLQSNIKLNDISKIQDDKSFTNIINNYLYKTSAYNITKILETANENKEDENVLVETIKSIMKNKFFDYDLFLSDINMLEGCDKNINDELSKYFVHNISIKLEYYEKLNRVFENKNYDLNENCNMGDEYLSVLIDLNKLSYNLSNFNIIYKKSKNIVKKFIEKGANDYIELVFSDYIENKISIDECIKIIEVASYELKEKLFNVLNNDKIIELADYEKLCIAYCKEHNNDIEKLNAFVGKTNFQKTFEKLIKFINGNQKRKKIIDKTENNIVKFIQYCKESELICDFIINEDNIELLTKSKTKFID